MTEPDYITVHEFCRRAATDVAVAYRLIYSGRLVAVKHPRGHGRVGTWRISPASAAAWIAQRDARLAARAVKRAVGAAEGRRDALAHVADMQVDSHD